MKDEPRKPPSAHPILWSLQDAMERNPYLRVGQLLLNATPVGRDLYYVEDEDLMAYLEAFIPNED